MASILGQKLSLVISIIKICLFWSNRNLFSKRINKIHHWQGYCVLKPFFKRSMLIRSFWEVVEVINLDGN